MAVDGQGGLFVDLVNSPLNQSGGAMRPVLTVTVNVPVMTDEQEGVFFADSPFLNIVTQGNSEEQALARFKEEMGFLLETSHSAGKLEALFDHRTSLRRGEGAPSEYVELRKRHYVPADIPARLLQRFTDAAASFH